MQAGWRADSPTLGGASYRVGLPQGQSHAGPSPNGAGVLVVSRARALDSPPAVRNQGVPGGGTESTAESASTDLSSRPRPPRRRHREPQQRPYRVTVRYNATENEVDELASARAQLARVGNSGNQIAFALNANGSYQPDARHDPGRLRHAIATVDTTAARLVDGRPAPIQAAGDSS